MSIGVLVSGLNDPKQRPFTLFGSTLPPSASGSPEHQLRQLTERLEGVDIVRLFDASLPSPWPQSVGTAGGLPVVVSYKADPDEVLAGIYDAELTSWFNAAPRTRPTYWAYYHEPEDQIERGDFDARKFREAWQHVDGIADRSGNEELHSTVILMCWTLAEKSARTYTDYVFEGMADVLAWDCYNHEWRQGTYVSPDRLLARAIAASTEMDAEWGLAELGSRIVVGDDGTGRAKWLRAVGAYAEQHDAAFVTYFDADIGVDFTLRDNASREALEDLAQ